MKWLIIQSDGMHKGQDAWSPNWFLRECYSFKDALERNGHAADVWGLRHDNFNQTPDFNSYDVVLIAENYEMKWLPDLSLIDKPLLIHWIIDLHWQKWEVYTEISKHCDVVLHATKSLIHDYSERIGSAKHLWFPNAIDDRYFKLDAPAERNIDMLFIGGNAATRLEALKQMQREAGLQYFYGVTGHDYIARVKSAKIQFNKNLNGDLNYRTFETIALGTCLLTENDPCLADLGFVHGRNCLIYGSIDQAVDLAKSAIETGQWEVVGAKGLQLSKEHTYTKRVEQLLKNL